MTEMEHRSQEERFTKSDLTTWQRIGPILTLLLFSPLIGEVMSGATRLSYIVVLIPEIMVWGCGALLIREWVRRWNGGWTSMLLLGFALAVAEEFIIQQTSIAPLPWLGDRPAYGRLWGVNWPWFLFMLGYEAVWIVLVPVQITELLFPIRRREPWLRRRGQLICAAVFLFGSFIAWYAWTQQARPNAFHVPIYHPPLLTVLSGAVAIIVLALLAYQVRRVDHRRIPRTIPPVWATALVALVMGLPWYGLMLLIFAPDVQLALGIPMVVATLWGAFVFLLLRFWCLSEGWRDMHRWALCLGALLVCMAGGFLGASSWPTMDIIGKAVLNALAIIGMAALVLRIRARRDAL